MASPQEERDWKHLIDVMSIVLIKKLGFGTEFLTVLGQWLLIPHSIWADREGSPWDGVTTPPQKGELTNKLLILRKQHKVAGKMIPFIVYSFSNPIYGSFLEHSSILRSQIQIQWSSQTSTQLYPIRNPWFPSATAGLGCRWGLLSWGTGWWEEIGRQCWWPMHQVGCLDAVPPT